MKVHELMTTAPKTATAGSNLAAVASTMWFGDCGAVPVVDEEGRVIGLLTDRDICIALASKSRPAADVLVRELLAGQVHTCGRDEDVMDALQRMRRFQVRRLPVVDGNGRLEGILSVTDALRAAQEKTPEAPGPEDVLLTLRALSKPSRRLPHESGAADGDILF